MIYIGGNFLEQNTPGRRGREKAFVIFVHSFFFFSMPLKIQEQQQQKIIHKPEGKMNPTLCSYRIYMTTNF